jgi:hypothetical protein
VRYVLPDWDCEASEVGKQRGGWIALDSAGELHAMRISDAYVKE